MTDLPVDPVDDNPIERILQQSLEVPYYGQDYSSEDTRRHYQQTQMLCLYYYSNAVRLTIDSEHEEVHRLDRIKEFAELDPVWLDTLKDYFCQNIGRPLFLWTFDQECWSWAIFNWNSDANQGDLWARVGDLANSDVSMRVESPIVLTDRQTQGALVNKVLIAIADDERTKWKKHFMACFWEAVSLDSFTAD